MTDDEFLLLPQSKARAYLRDQDSVEAARLRLLYNSKEGAARASALNKQSTMRQLGIAGTVISALFFFLSLGSVASEPSNIGFPILAGSAFGTFAFMWMLGAIEQRLIEINASIKHRG